MAFGDSEEATSFDETVEQITETENTSGLESGDTCPDCSNKLHKREHPRDEQLGTERHPDAPETEIVCRHHGVQESF